MPYGRLTEGRQTNAGFMTVLLIILYSENCAFIDDQLFIYAAVPVLVILNMFISVVQIRRG